MKIQTTMIALASAILTGCANLAPVATPSGNPEVTINSNNMSRVKGALVSAVAASGYSLVNDMPYGMSFTRQMDIGSTLLYTVAMGNSYSSTPSQSISFTFAPAGGNTHVFAHSNISMQGVFGQDQGMNMDRGRGAHEIQAMLEQVKSQIEGSKSKRS